MVRDTHSTHKSSVTDQIFDSSGQQSHPERPESQFRYEPGHSSQEPYGFEESADSEVPEVDHPRMRSSLDSDRGEPFLSSPLGSTANVTGA